MRALSLKLTFSPCTKKIATSDNTVEYKKFSVQPLKKNMNE